MQLMTSLWLYMHSSTEQQMWLVVTSARNRASLSISISIYDRVYFNMEFFLYQSVIKPALYNTHPIQKFSFTF